MAGQFKAGEIVNLSLPDVFSLLHKVEDKHPNWSSVSRPPYSWNGDLTYNQALRFAEFGWPDAPQLGRIVVPNVHDLIQDQTCFYDVCGEVLDVPAYISGSTPDCWINYEDEPKTSNVIRLAVEIGGLGDVSADSMKNRGEAIIAMINSLELAGHSIELNIVRCFSESRYGDADYTFLIRVKDAGQVMDIQRVQFMLGHPAFYRRCLFGLSEIAKGSSMDKKNTWTRSYAPDGYVHIPHNCGRYEDSEDSMYWAKVFAETISEQEPALA